MASDSHEIGLSRDQSRTLSFDSCRRCSRDRRKLLDSSAWRNWLQLLLTELSLLLSAPGELVTSSNFSRHENLAFCLDSRYHVGKYVTILISISLKIRKFLTTQSADGRGAVGEEVCGVLEF